MVRPVTPLHDALLDLHARLSVLEDGEVATYIPELGRASPDDFAICITTADGHTYCAGDARVAFTIQSISKPFVYGLALDDAGPRAVNAKVGVEPSGEAFNAISLEHDTGRPRNPMINAGAIATASLANGDDNAEKLDRVVRALSRFAGRALEIDPRSTTPRAARDIAIALSHISSGTREYSARMLTRSSTGTSCSAPSSSLPRSLRHGCLDREWRR